MIARHEIDRFGIDLAQAHFWSGKIGHDGHAPPRFLSSLTNATNDLGVSWEITVRKIQPRNIESCLDQPRQHLGRFRGRTDRGDDLGFVSGQSCVHDANTNDIGCDFIVTVECSKRVRSNREWNARKEIFLRAQH